MKRVNIAAPRVDQYWIDLGLGSILKMQPLFWPDTWLPNMTWEGTPNPDHMPVKIGSFTPSHLGYDGRRLRWRHILSQRSP